MLLSVCVVLSRFMIPALETGRPPFSSDSGSTEPSEVVSSKDLRLFFVGENHTLHSQLAIS
jgi:hypothetical protein